MSLLSLDRESKTPVSTQLIEQLRYLIASGHYKVNDTLPSTRKLGDRLGVSFHTVRKAYQALEEEGLLNAQVGSGYTVQERTPLDKSERMEQGAQIVNESLQRLIGLGLNDAEIEYLFQEQTNLLDHASMNRKLILVGPYAEINDMAAEQISGVLQRTVRSVPIASLDRHEDADYVFTTFEHLDRVMRSVPRADTIGYVTHLPATVLEKVARLREHDTLGLVTRSRETIPPLSNMVRQHSAFGGQVIAASIEEGTEHLDSFIDQTDLLLYTAPSRRRLLPLLGDEPPRSRLQILVSQDSLDAIAEAVPA
ncbi:MAG: GntR family transcriptional regulator [Bacteroidetes bacterium]|jgi:GntR family transcriptional regulator|nr:GntR family transcriptional regulator [Bacteroidota bacterium]